MGNARFSLLVFGIYTVFVVGIGFMFIPLQILQLFGLTAGDDVWIHFVGMLASIIGFYYIQVARSSLVDFVPWTVIGRYYAAAFMVLLVVLRMVAPSLLIFAAIDIGGATWTWLGVRSAKAYKGIF